MPAAPQASSARLAATARGRAPNSDTGRPGSGLRELRAPTWGRGPGRWPAGLAGGGDREASAETEGAARADGGRGRCGAGPGAARRKCRLRCLGRLRCLRRAAGRLSRAGRDVFPARA